MFFDDDVFGDDEVQPLLVTVVEDVREQCEGSVDLRDIGGGELVGHGVFPLRPIRR